MGVLDRISSPADLRPLSDEEMKVLSAEIRTFLIEKVAATGGHLGPNLGVVELTLGIHRVFDSPSDPILFDTGHQSYVHKIVTGRKDGFDQLRQRGGLTGYQERAESEHDWVESSHASAALSYADGLAKSFELTGQPDRTVVAVVGDGALTGGMCWEAINNIAACNRRVVIVVNDNGRSYAPTIGGLASHLSGLRLQPGYEKFLDEGRRVVKQVPHAALTYPMFDGLGLNFPDRGASVEGRLAVVHGLEEVLQRLRLVPGMLVNAEIHLGSRSVLEYLFSPIQKIAHEAARER